ncbi:DUF3352 domain-containing protein [Waterburya agarophytonicola K14]|uniref:DUF3352 domain-containing protein n=1 Tax=Waterburya agarophytonicola KI4 TaxID=2874699 RepID=A0A964BT08_9CYAN|nr:DUF3352 domain-containing protein [Waterburya agarophytonicola]MCC0177998.1 DUF3352 domain-containing protein [Waterburya agarophytonicola KI4]
MKFRSFFWTLTAGAITIFLIAVVGMGWIASSSSIALLPGGVNRFPLAAAFIPKQAPGMVSLLTNPEKLNAIYRVTLPLQERQRERLEWQQWETDLLGKIGFNYQRDVKPWLGDEITLAIASLDSDRNPKNGAQPGYILAAATKNNGLAKESLRQFYSTKNNISIEPYKGTNIIFPKGISDFWSSVVVGDFVLFANQPQILKEAINQAQAIELNLARADSYQNVLNNIQQPHIGIGYIDVFGLSAWLDKSTISTQANSKPILGIALSIKGADLAARTLLIEADKTTVNSLNNKSFLDNLELQQILNSLPFNDRNLAYIEINNGKSLLEDRIPLYKVTKLAIQSLFPHLKAIAIQNIGKQDNISRANILFKLDS